MATATEAEEANPETSGFTMESQFYNFARYGEETADGKTITLTKSDKWMKQAKILDGKNVTLTDTGFCFSKFKAYAIKFDDYMIFLEDLAQYKQLDAEEIKNKLVLCGLPGASEKQDDKKRRR
ncbi:TPPP family protein CG45057 isoform X2 [Agrilus planipennis]|uniref:TPPP family protein CG45057 isoform X2 n=1 Tax=Agrilus planipennis TaxID=224129 RepID=A0A7F5RG98_AGRPL|nr:TPPP family protein CG45057 isoform X2 [Agrilus planipennis]